MTQKILIILLCFFGFSINAQTNLTLSSLPVQINFNQNATAVYNFSAPITNIVSRNNGLISWTISGNQVTFTGIKAGRTGLKIVSGGTNYYMGLRINHTDGSIPGMPDYLSIGSVSEDLVGDLDFWKDLDIDATNKAMDIRYIYINGGVNAPNGWQSWGANRPNNFAKESLRLGLIPFFVYYNIPDNAEDYAIDLAHAQSPSYMTAYFADLNTFMDKVQTEMNGDLYGIILEPDFLGYMQQQAVPNNPNLITTSVGNNTIATNAGTIKTLVSRINKTISDKRITGHKIFFGWQLNLWSYANHASSKGIIRRTDDMNFDAAKHLIKISAEETTLYGMNAGILSNGADFISIDKYGLDAMGQNTTTNPFDCTWFFNNDHWNNYLLYAKTIHNTSSKPVILWQLPVGRVNQSNYVSAYTGTLFPDMPNISTKYEDSTTNFFLGDNFTTTNQERIDYFSQNIYNDSKNTTNAGTINWQNHLQETKDSGIISVLFGAGVNASTDGVGSPPSDNYFWIQKVQNYYQNGTISLGQTYGENPLNPCASGCLPTINFISPTNGSQIIRSQLDAIKIKFWVNDNDGYITNITLSIDGTPITLANLDNLQVINWTATSFGNHTASVSVTDNSGNTVSQAIVFEVVDFNASACGYPEWNSATVYNVANTFVAYNGLIYKNKWWTQNEMPYLGGTDTPWSLEGVCASVLGISSIINEEYHLFSIAPNPSNEGFVVRSFFKNNRQNIYHLMDINGRIVSKNQSANDEIFMNTNQLQNGLYILQISNEEGVFRKKIIVKH